jgi:hypothetical protein
MNSDFDLYVRLETLPGIASHAVITRQSLAALGNLLIQLGSDPTRDGVLLLMHENGDVSLSSKGIGNDAGHA